MPRRQIANRVLGFSVYGVWSPNKVLVWGASPARSLIFMCQSYLKDHRKIET